MKWTLTKKNGQYVVRFLGEIPQVFSTRDKALAYINDKVMTALGI